MFSPEVLTLRVMHWLEAPQHLAQAPVLQAYLAEGGDFRRYELASRLADTFDQYLVYRPDWLAAWEANQPGRRPDGQPMRDEEAHWQAQLWRDLVSMADLPAPPPEEAGKTASHRAQTLQALQHQLERGEGVERLPKRVSLLGITSLPPVYMALLKQLARYTDVCFFALNPCAAPWGDIRDSAEQARLAGGRDPAELYLEVGNPLLASWGKQGRDFFDSLAAEAALVEVFDEAAATPASLLQALQQDVLTLTDRQQGEPIRVAADDRSLQLHICHSPMREVEVLHDQLLALFQADPQLQPAEVVVLTPDIETYAPYIDAVFAQQGDPARNVPYSIADRTDAKASPLAQVFLTLLTLPDARFTAEWVLGLLDIAAVRQRFGLTETDLPRIQRWVAAAGVRWARDAAHKAEQGLPATQEHTWREGLTRMLLGVALPQQLAADGVPLYASAQSEVLPFDEIEGQAADVAARLAAFVAALQQASRQLSQPAALAQWCERLQAVAAALLAPADEADQQVFGRLQEAIATLAELAVMAHYDTPVTLPVVRSWLSGQLEHRSAGGGFLTGGVTFCTMVPMRSLPFKVIAVLGLDDATFPRRQRPHGFDLIARYPRTGDRSRRADDRYLFLETLLSARQVLYLSYVGRDQRSDAPLSASILLNDLEQLLQTACVPADWPADSAEPLARREGGRQVLAACVTRHPLQPFDPRYFQGDPRLPGFHTGWWRTAQQVGQGRRQAQALWQGPLPPAPEEMRQVWFDDLAEALLNPAQCLLKQRAGLYLPRAIAQLADSEPFALDYDSRRQLRRFALNLLQQNAAAATERLGRAAGLLPHGAWGQRDQAEQLALVEQIQAWAEPLRSGEPAPGLAWALHGADGLQLSGWLDALWPAGRVQVLLGKASPYRQLPAWLAHLALCWQRPPGVAPQSWLVAEDGVFFFTELSAAAAEQQLRTLLACYWQIVNQPQPLFSKTSSAYMTEWLKRSAEPEGEALEQALHAAAKAWQGSSGPHGLAGERDNDAWIALLWRGQEPLQQQQARFIELAETVWRPLLQHWKAQP